MTTTTASPRRAALIPPDLRRWTGAELADTLAGLRRSPFGRFVHAEIALVEAELRRRSEPAPANLWDLPIWGRFYDADRSEG